MTTLGREIEGEFAEFKKTRFATPEEIAACRPVREALHAGGRVLHYQNQALSEVSPMLASSGTGRCCRQRAG